MLPNFNSGEVLQNTMLFLPELLICATIVLLLVLRLLPLFDHTHLGLIALAPTVLAVVFTVQQWLSWSEAGSSGQNQPYFWGMLVNDHITLYLRCFLYGFTALVIWLTLVTGIPDREDSADFYCLLLGAALGMVIMASANHLLMVYIGVEMASLPSYALAGYLKGRRESSEAALKYVVYGGGSAGIMLYGISLLAGRFGTASLPDVAAGLALAIYPPGGPAVVDPILILSVLFIFIGLAFKLAAVPFHFWCPDVFEGASAEVAGFLSVASKGAAIALLARISLLFGGLDPLVGRVDGAKWMSMVQYLVPALAFFAALTATFGNLAAFLQTNLKRLLAYSTIAHAGYMMMGVAALTREGLQAVLFYLVAYLFMNLGAFAIVAFLRNMTGSEDLASYRGLVRRAPCMVITLAFCLLSLLGIPPLVGFIAKFQVFAALFHAGQQYGSEGGSGLSATMYGLLVVGGVNSVFSAVYYLKVLKVMIIEGRAEDLEGREPVRLREPMGGVVYAGLMAAAVAVLGVVWWPVDRVSAESITRFNTRPGEIRESGGRRPTYSAPTRPGGQPGGGGMRGGPGPGGGGMRGPGPGGGRPGGGMPAPPPPPRGGGPQQ